jgi:hypothetical protein
MEGPGLRGPVGTYSASVVPQCRTRRQTFDLVLPVQVLDFTTVLGQGPLKVHGPGGPATCDRPVAGGRLAEHIAIVDRTRRIIRAATSLMSVLRCVSVTISGLSMVVPEHSGDPSEPDRQSLAFGRGQSVQQLGVLGVQFLPDPPGRGLPVVGELESVEASIVWVPLS